MAFNRKYLSKVTSSGNGFGPTVWAYNGSTADGADDTAAEIAASAYFNTAQVSLTTATGTFSIGDVINARGSDANGMLAVTAVTTNVTTESYAAIGTIDTAQLAAEAVTFAKIEDIAVTSLLGNSTAGEQAVEEITLANGLEFSGTTLQMSEDTIRSVSKTITAAEVLLLATTPIELVAAPGADKVIQFLGAEIILNYGTTAYTESGDNLGIKYTDAAGVQVSETIEATGFATLTADSLTNAIPKKDVIVAASGCVNKALVLDNLGSNWANSGDSPITFVMSYNVVTAGL